MIRVFLLGVAAWLGWRFVQRRGRPDADVLVGWVDGSSVSLPPGNATREVLVDLAEQVL